MNTLAEADEIHPEALVTVKVYVPAGSNEIVELVPDPVVVVPPGDLVKVHVPDAGRPFITTLPVVTEIVGCVIVATFGAVGAVGWALITTLADAGEIHPDALVTVKAYVPAGSNEIVELVPVPVVVDPPCDLVKVQVPVVGNPFKTTLPVANAQVGCVIVPTVGAVGVVGWALMTTLADAGEIHPEALVTVKVYVPARSNEIVELVPVPDVVVPPGDLVKVHVPDAGNPFKATLPVAKAQVGCVIVPTFGAVGAVGWALMTTLADAGEIHPEALVTVKVYVPA
jgi:hypothetical protein